MYLVILIIWVNIEDINKAKKTIQCILPFIMTWIYLIIFSLHKKTPLIRTVQTTSCWWGSERDITLNNFVIKFNCIDKSLLITINLTKVNLEIRSLSYSNQDCNIYNLRKIIFSSRINVIITLHSHNSK